mgnify:CR=1 FL=1
MIGYAVAQALKLAASNKKFIDSLKFDAATKWARTNLLKQTPLAKFKPDPKNARRLLRK